MILIPQEANNIFTKNGFLFYEVGFHFKEHDLIRIGNNCLTLNGAVFGRGSFIENGITNHIGIIQGSQIDGIRIDVIWKRRKRPIEIKHAWDSKNLSKLIEAESNLKVPNGEGDEIKVDSRKDLADVGIIKIGGVNDTTFMEKVSLVILKNGSFVGVETRGLMIFGNVKGSVLVVDMVGFRHLERK
ncbi:hypothetical protein Tco_0492655 [Tanacetum coccineum]